ncbi:extracellular matrix protein 3-like [Centruroides sculpturatus]|uniref:extracellular matrix protein 3-like n=1 Tax=Centruroides sculpturatus TaxID=218467 RepID=UPI000C6E9F17|nr:extracellular matrix protein 3-like [Centruroides sculpturatus]
MEATRLCLVLVGACLVVAQGVTEQDLVSVNNGIAVPFGRSVYVHPDRDLRIRVSNDDRCTVKVIQNDPLSQISGRLTPGHFPCQFGPHDVQYVHFGARSPPQDKVKLLIRYDSEDDTYIIPVTVHVQVLFEQLEIVTKNMPLVVERLGDVSTPIDNRVLQFTYDKNRQNCKVTILSSASGLPRYGEVINDANAGMMEDCDVFLNSDIRYRHTFLTDSPNKDFLPLVAELTDSHGNVLKQEYFQIMVRIKEGNENTPPQLRFTSLLLLDVNQFVMTAITPSILSAEDAETSPEKLIFNITSPLGYGEGIIVSTDDQDLPITSFYQKDVEDLKIAYKPPASDSDVKRLFRVDLEVVDSEGLTSEAFALMFVVKPMNSLAPLATRNTRLMLFEGQSRKLQSSKNLEIADEDNIDDVTLEVVDGLRHGKLLLLGSPVKHFSPADLDAGLVVYQHDGSDTSSDNIIFRLDDGKHKVEFLFPVTIYPEDDEAPIVNINKGLTITKDEEVVINHYVLSATDIDSDDYRITFELQEPPEEGVVLKKQTEVPDDPNLWSYIDGVYEIPVTSWTQEDLLEGRIFYRHTGQHYSEPIVELLKFKVYDDNIPPNGSDEQEFLIKIFPKDNIPPELQPNSDLHLVVHEFELTDITKKQMRYHDLDTRDRDLVIRIVRKPFDLDPANPLDPGKIVFSEYPDHEVGEFSQAQINHHKIAYKPPSIELGIVPRDIQFEFEVVDSAGNVLPAQKFTIRLVPVDNKPPVITNSGLNVYENGFAIITPDILDATDQDTDSDSILFTVKKVPSHGSIQLGTFELGVGDFFTRRDISNGLVSYVNSGAEMDNDKFAIEATDGIHKVPVIIHIHIRPIDDEAPQLQIAPGTLGVRLSVKESGRTAITNDVLKASDPDTDDTMITFLIDELPRFGYIEVNGIISDRFKQHDIQNKRVYYVHNRQEIGLEPVIDSFNLTISDMSNDWIVGGNRIDHIHVVVDVEPVDNVPPNVVVGPLFTVLEGNKSTITLLYLNATDVDTEVDDIICTIIDQPSKGYVENTSPGPGSEIPRDGIPITAFTIADLRRNSINYVQSIHKKTEPTQDEFTFSCSDGVNFAPTLLFLIHIEPTNDEEPEMFMREFIVYEGRDLVIDLPILNAIDADIPKDKLVFTIKTKPKHGRIVSHTTRDTKEITSFTLDQIRQSSSILYQHDNSESIEDEFELELTDGLHNTSKKFLVMIIPVDDETPRLTINNGLEIGLGESKLITNQMLKAEDLDSDDGNITYIVRQAPRYGNLVFLDPETDIPLFNLTNGMNFTQADIDDNLIMYIQLGREGVRDLIKFDITDGTNSFIDRYFWVTIEGIDVLYPDVINRGVELPEGGKITLNTNLLSTSDLNSDDEFLEFSITRAPSRGHLENSDHPGLPITSFTQLDLAGNKISYVHTSEDEIKMDSFEFEVSDGFNSVYRTFRISISDLDNKKPIVYANKLRVKEGGDRLISPFELKVEDRDSDDNLLRVLVIRPPAHGKILYDHQNPTNTFTMSDLNENLVTYHHDGSETVEDSFTFIVTDGTHTDFFLHPYLDKETKKPVTMEIEIIPVDNVVPKLSINRGATSIGPLDNDLLGFQFTNKVLRAEDRDSQDINLLYIITTPPEHGVIINEALGNDSVSMFTQGKNELDNQQFLINWSWISLEHDFYSINETEKFLKINLKRRGYLGETSFVGVQVKNMTAKQGLDFGSYFAKQVQFNPGQVEARWKIRILDDSLYEKREQFLIVLEDPVMAALEYPEKTVVTIIDEEDVSTVFIPKEKYIVKEDSGELLIPIERRGDISQEMMVVCSTESDSATGTSHPTVLSYSDYISRPQDHNSIIRFNRGEKIEYCRIIIIDDSLYEEDETFYVKLSTAIGGELGKYDKAKIVIESDDKDVPSFYFGEPEYYVDESNGYVEVMIWRTGTDLSKQASVTVQSRPSDPVSAEAGQDYIGIGKNLDFAPGITMQTFRVIILDDLGQPILEGSETFELVLRMPMNAILGDPHTATVVINDSLSDLPRMQFKFPTYVGFENDKKVVTVITRRGDVSHMSAVRCYTRQDSAEVSLDFVERPDTNDSFVIFVPGETEKQCVVELVDDRIHELDEEFRLVLGTPISETAGGGLLGSPNVTKITIKDDGDKPVIKFNKTRISIKEPQKSDDVAIVHIPVVRLGDLSKTSIVRVHTKDGSAKSGFDYLPLSKELHFGPNVSEIMVDVEVLFDGEKEHREAFTVHLRPDKNMIAEIKYLGAHSPFWPPVVTCYKYSDIIYGRIMVDPVQNLGDSFFMTIEKCFICTGVDGYIPKYEPTSLEYGCVADSPNLLHTFKIIDKGAPHTVVRKFKNVPFDAKLSGDDPSPDVEALRKQPSADGFHFDSAPLFQVSYGRQWFVHCIYTVRSKENAARGIGKRSVDEHIFGNLGEVSLRKKREVEDVEHVGSDGKGTNMHRIKLNYNGKNKKVNRDNKGVYEVGQNSHSEDGMSLIPIIVGALGSILVIAIAVNVYLIKRRKEFGGSASSSGVVSVVASNGQSRVVSSQYQNIRAGDNTEV